MNTAHDSYVADNSEQVLDAFNDCGWEAVLDGVSHNNYASISQALHEAATEAGNNGRQAHSKVLRLLAEACSMRLLPDKPNEPFGPSWVSGGRRSAIADDFTDSEIDFFAKISDTIDNPFLKGRLADLVWHRRVPRDIGFALAAIDSYKQIPLNVATWFRGGEQCWQRAIGLSRMVGKAAGENLNQIESSMIEALKLATTQDGFFIHRLADTLMSSGFGKSHSTIVAEKLESLASEFDASGDFHASESFYNASAKWFKHSGDNEKSTDMTVAEAEAFVNEATARLSSDKPSYGVAASFLEDAVQVYRSIPRVHTEQPSY